MLVTVGSHTIRCKSLMCHAVSQCVSFVVPCHPCFVSVLVHVFVKGASHLVSHCNVCHNINVFDRVICDVTSLLGYKTQSNCLVVQLGY